MQIKLKVLRGARSGAEFKIGRREFVIGRGQGCHLRTSSQSVSRRHCAIVTRDSGVFVLDLNSRNGVFVNDERVVKERALEAGDRLRMGPFEFEVLMEWPIKREPPPAEPHTRPGAAREDGGSYSDFDVLEWLSEPASPAAEPVESETEARELGDTVRMRLEAAAARPEQEEAERAAADPAAKRPGKRASREPGKLPPRPVVKSPDTRTAAEEALHRHFDGR
jgi:predicted component of type VI protein secretion system